VRELTDTWSAQASSTRIDVTEHTNALTFEIIARAGFSHSFRSMADQHSDPFVEAMVREPTYANRRTDVLPVFEWFFRRGRAGQHQEDLKHAHSVVDSIIAGGEVRRRRRHPALSPLAGAMKTRTDPNDDGGVRALAVTRPVSVRHLLWWPTRLVRLILDIGGGVRTRHRWGWGLCAGKWCRFWHCGLAGRWWVWPSSGRPG
jgi:hypothetical protein